MAYALSQLHWPALAQDLAVVAASGSPTKDYSGVLRTYGIKDAELAEIISVPKFKMLFEYAVKDCKEIARHLTRRAVMSWSGSLRCHSLWRRNCIVMRKPEQWIPRKPCGYWSCS